MALTLENTKEPSENEVEPSLRLRLSEDSLNTSLKVEQQVEDTPELNIETEIESKGNSRSEDAPSELIPEIIFEVYKDADLRDVQKSHTNLSPKPERGQELPLGEIEKADYFKFLKLEEKLDEELSKLRAELDAAPLKQTTMNYLHEYNNIKDAAQVVLGALATMREATIASLHKEFNLPTVDE